MPGSTSDVVVVGASTAGLRAAEAVARQAPELTVTVLGDEPHLPYELPPLSKVALDEPLELDSLVYPSAVALREKGVDFRLGVRVESLDLASRAVRHSGGEVGYRALVIATGCEPVVPPSFAGLPHVHALRRFEDATALRSSVADPSRSVAIVGAGFIGGEFASTLRRAGRDVALIDMAPAPLGGFGEAVADGYAALHRDAGVRLHLGRAVVDVVQRSGRRALVLADGTTIPADVILLGVGVRPSTEWLQGAGLTLEDGIVADSTLRVAPDVFAAGDVVRWPNPRFDAVMRIEHWTTAAEQGRGAGRNAVNVVRGLDPAPVATVPYFWSDQHGVRIQFAGHLTGAEEIEESRTPDGRLLLYRQGEVVTGVLAFQRRAEFVRVRAALRQELTLDRARELGAAGDVAVSA